MTYNCPTCTAALKFNPKIGKLECLSCENTYETNEFTQKNRLEEEKNTLQAEDLQNTSSPPISVMRMKACSCSACGAKLAVNDTESSTYCLYCGQPSIVFDRVISARKPKYIIPFSITKEEALARIRKSLRFRFTIPKKIIHFEVEKLQGIYIPYWLFDTKCQGEIKFYEKSHNTYHSRVADFSFQNITVESSLQLHNELSKRLEPYDLSTLEPFNPAYFSGFYADCFDAPQKQLNDIACSRSKEITNEKMKRSILRSINGIELYQSYLTCNITNSHYAMLPAWFLSFRYKNEAYQILVNGQTGKVVGDFPISKGLVITLGILLGIPVSLIIFSSLMDYFTLAYLGFPPLLIPGVLGYLFIAMFVFNKARKSFNELKNRVKIAKDIKTNTYIKNRTDGD